MSGNSFGRLFRITTFGESHGKAIGTVIDGCPPGIALSQRDFERDMAKRAPKGLPFHTTRVEKDRVEIISGVFEGKTTGAPITLIIWNHDVNSKPYEILRKAFRPGHGEG